MHRHPPPNHHDLLLPVIACLPTAFFSPQPPPALLPLLSPILRQRLSLSSQSQTKSSNSHSTTSSSNWLNLLTWSPTRAQELHEIISILNLEPHPVSGELELFEDEEPQDEAGRTRYRRLDPETLHAKCDIRKLNLSVVWVWCVNDTGAVGMDALTATKEGTSDGWRVAEVRPLEGTEGEVWYDSQGEAEDAADADAVPSAPRGAHMQSDGDEEAEAADDDDDDDYWASYDRTPGPHTPAQKRSPAPPSTSGLAPLTSIKSDDETAYLARYGNEVQPAMDQYDPSEEEGTGEVQSSLGPEQGQRQRPREPPTPPCEEGLHSDKAGGERQLHSPSPSHPHSPTGAEARGPGSGASPVDKLEAAASATTAAEVGVKQHISTEMKSLYRLARGVGIEREEFERVVGRELEVLGMLEG